MEASIGVLSLLVLFVAYIYKVLSSEHGFFKQRGIAFIKPKILFGNMYNAFFDLENHETTMKEFYNEFRTEKLYGIFDFLRPKIIIKDFDLIKQIAVENFHKFINRDSCEIDDIISKSMFSLEDNQWQEMRNAIESFFDKSNINEFQSDFNSIIDDLMNHFERRKTENFDTKDIFEKFLSNIISIVVLGKGRSCMYDEASEVYEIVKNIEEDLTSLSGGFKFFLLTHFPTIAKRFNVRVFHKKIYNFLREHVNDEISFRERRKIENRKDFLQHLINAKKQLNWINGEYFFDAQVMMFFTSGFSTTSTLFQACCFVLAKNEEVQDEIFKEIQQKQFNFEELNDFKYFNKFINETLRKWMPISCSTRICKENCTIESKIGEKFKFFKGDLIHIPYRLIFNDPKIQDDPQRFNPHRNDKHEIFPFGIGPRKCIGKDFANFQVKLVIFHILQKYRIVPSHLTPNELKFACDKSGFTEKVIVELELREN